MRAYQTQGQVAQAQGIDFEVVPRVHDSAKGEVEEGIHAARMLFPRCWFGATRCQQGLDALMHYRRDYNQKLGEFKATPVHDQASHGADAFRYLALWQKAPERERERRRVDLPVNFSWS